MNIARLFLCAGLLILVAGCAPKTRYSWNDYDNKLYQHYRNPAEYDEFVEHLKEVIEEGESEGRVPPGVYAEYGFALYEKGKFSESVTFFQKEHDKWPESRVLMVKMIQNAKARGQKSAQANPAEVKSIQESSIQVPQTIN